MLSKTVREYRKATRAPWRDEDWVYRISPSTKYWLHKPSMRLFEERTGKEPGQLLALATALIQELPASERWGEINSQLGGVDFRYCVGFFNGETLIYSPEVAGGAEVLDHEARWTTGTDKYVTY